jgi:4-carboxymuconolactone decarboxylase
MTRIIATALGLALAAPVIARAQDGPTILRGTPPTERAPAENFTGAVRVGNRFQAEAPARTYGATVSFEAGARTHWHIHPLGQILVVTAGTGRVQHWRGSVREIRPGDVVHIPPGVKHWHGASPDAAMTHVALVEAPAAGPTTEWMDAVTDDQYAAQPERSAPSPAVPGSEDNGPSRAQQLMGDIAPRLAELTDDVLFGQVWTSPELSQRDRSLVTISALIALNRPDQLRSHLIRARSNGVTQEEVIGAITHLAFYAGWPNAVTAVSVAREVFRVP